MRIAFALFLAVHGAIHLIGAAKAFRLAALPQLTQIAPTRGVVWLVAAALFLAAAAGVLLWPRWWWAIGAAAAAVSLAAILPSWSDAKFGAVANGVVLLGVAFGFLANGPFSLRAEYDRDVAWRLSRPAAPDPITRADLARLPPLVRRYLEGAGIAAGDPRVRNFRARMRGRIRSGPDAPWMAFDAEQHNVLSEPARLFYMTASRLAVPIQGYHRYAGRAATMRIKAAAAVTLFDVGGPEMRQGETVTLFNDLCIMAPAALIDPAIAWQPVDARTIRARFTAADVTIGADLVFGEGGELVDFRSTDRYRISDDGRSMERLAWSTPLKEYRALGGARLASRGEARWSGPAGEFAYIELEIADVEYNVER